MMTIDNEKYRKLANNEPILSAFAYKKWFTKKFYFDVTRIFKKGSSKGKGRNDKGKH